MRLVVLAALCLGTGCKTQWSAKVEQPPLLLGATKQARTSLPAAIVVRDMELPRVLRLVNSAYYVVVSRDRLRFHLQIDHKWQEWADVNTWSAELVDDKGRHWIPEGVEHAKTKILTRMWDMQQRAAVCDGRGRKANDRVFIFQAIDQRRDDLPLGKSFTQAHRARADDRGRVGHLPEVLGSDATTDAENGKRGGDPSPAIERHNVASVGGTKVRRERSANPAGRVVARSPEP